MATAYVYSFASVLLVSLVSLAGIFALLLTGRFLQRVIFILVSLSVGVLFGDVFIHMLPEIYAVSPESPVVPFLIISGIIAFFSLEKFFRWGHAHEHHGHGLTDVRECRHKNEALGSVVLAGDSLHNFIDGVIITSSFVVGTELGIATLVAVILHEIPQEIGDFGILLHAGYGKAKALLYNFMSALASFLGLATTAVLGSVVEDFSYIAIAVAAGGFLYIAGSDLVPELQKTSSARKSLVQLASMLAGFTVMFALLAIE